jgi:hypothetical protein
MDLESSREIEKEEREIKEKEKQERPFPRQNMSHTLQVGPTFAFLKSTYKLVNWHRLAFIQN